MEMPPPGDILKWFSTKPKENGFHWLRRKGEKDTIVLIYDIESGFVEFGAMVAHIGTDWDSSLIDVIKQKQYECQWFGPIDPPCVESDV